MEGDKNNSVIEWHNHLKIRGNFYTGQVILLCCCRDVNYKLTSQNKD